jgi:hypothetical protein
MKRHLLLPIIALGLAACSSEPPPIQPSYRERQAARRPVIREVAAPPRGHQAPIDRWKERLAERLPAPWTLASVEAQVEAPPGWTRISGDRGMLFRFQDGANAQDFWLLPAPFDGRIFDPTVAAEVRARSDEFVLYGPRQDVPGWGATATVVDALELH